MPILARVGERITCSNGHEVAIVVETIQAGENLDEITNKLGSWQTGGYSGKLCMHCGKPWAKLNAAAWNALHISGEWRGEDPTSSGRKP